MDEAETGHLELESYRKAARSEGAAWNYKGLEIHAIPAIHERVAALAAGALPAGARVLDLASGSGAMCLRLRDLGLAPTGCDIVAENFRLHGSVPFIPVNLNHPLPEDMVGAFDCVIATELIEHLENPRHLLRQCFRALRPGGVLFVSTPNIDSPISQALHARTGEFQWFGEAEYRRDGHITPVSRRTLERALTEAWFVGTRVDSVAPVEFAGLAWWKMRALAWVLARVSTVPVLAGQIMVAEALRAEGG
jgi:2-polyprenyl-3-methyl-5-hydroxy-6-metoxy-1,4-benzoquinol methylase